MSQPKKPLSLFTISLIKRSLKIKIQAALSQCVHAVLEEYRKNFSDIPYIQYFKPYITKSLLDEEDLWTIANLDKQYAEYRKLNKSIDYLKSKQSDESVVEDIDSTLELYETDINILKLTKTYLELKNTCFDNIERAPSKIVIKK